VYSTLISADVLREHAGRPGWIVLDARFRLDDPEAGRRAWWESHIPGSRYVHLDEDLSSPVTPSSGRHPLPDSERLAARFGALGIGDDRQVVVYDDAGGSIAARAWWLLRALGHDAVAVLDGGIQAWQEAGGALDTAVPEVVPRDFTPRPRNDLALDASALKRALRARAVLVDVREPERFEGRREPIDAIAGHVPGAVNLPWRGNVDERGRFRSAAALRARHEAMLGGRPPESVVFMCGSGVTACHGLLAMEHAGLHGARLYAGSWSEWIRDPARPVVTGP
jgi:thiosulfate/3-mercaptopyruvate sulfurtransferase